MLVALLLRHHAALCAGRPQARKPMALHLVTARLGLGRACEGDGHWHWLVMPKARCAAGSGGQERHQFCILSSLQCGRCGRGGGGGGRGAGGIPPQRKKRTGAGAGGRGGAWRGGRAGPWVCHHHLLFGFWIRQQSLPFSVLGFGQHLLFWFSYLLASRVSQSTSRFRVLGFATTISCFRLLASESTSGCWAWRPVFFRSWVLSSLSPCRFLGSATNISFQAVGCCYHLGFASFQVAINTSLSGLGLVKQHLL